MNEQTREPSPRKPSMEFETRTENLLVELLPRVDPDRTGTCIEIGVGTYHWYCELFAKAGYRSIAVEPIPAARFLKRLTRTSITFYEGVVSDQDGTATVYLGKGDDTNLSSIRPDWWAATTETKVVPSMTLDTVIRRAGIAALTCLKIDAEGTEERILRQLRGLSPALRPRIVVFEFGAAVFSEGKWLPHFDCDTMSCLRILQGAGTAPPGPSTSFPRSAAATSGPRSTPTCSSDRIRRRATSSWSAAEGPIG
jgi:FkbM family methyltransferase